MMACSGDWGRGGLAVAADVLRLPAGLGLGCGWLRQRVGQGLQQVAAGAEVGGGGLGPPTRDELKDGGSGRPVVDAEPHARRRAQRPAGQAGLDPAGAEVRIVLGRPAQHAVAQVWTLTELRRFERLTITLLLTPIT
jgi:hypothetical protein